jgi:hypothetical protein
MLGRIIFLPYKKLLHEKQIESRAVKLVLVLKLVLKLLGYIYSQIRAARSVCVRKGQRNP